MPSSSGFLAALEFSTALELVGALEFSGILGLAVGLGFSAALRLAAALESSTILGPAEALVLAEALGLAGGATGSLDELDVVIASLSLLSSENPTDSTPGPIGLCVTYTIRSNCDGEGEMAID